MEDEIQRAREDALVEQGLASQVLLEGEAFNSVVRRLSDAFSQQLFATQPHEQKTREMYYNQTLALQAIVDLLLQDVAVANEIIEARNEAE